jgi:ribosomal protein S18 acetylase RimI-like enzyme
MSAVVSLDPLQASDFDTLATLAHTIWHEHYGSFIERAQLDYMLEGRFSADNLARYLDSDQRWMRVLRVDGAMVGYCSHALGERPDEMKLEQLYLLAAHKGQGLGGRMMRHIEDAARAAGRPVLFLTVNKGNADSIAIYRKAGFTVREAAVFDIGRGYVMDDYVMEKRL